MGFTETLLTKNDTLGFNSSTF